MNTGREKKSQPMHLEKKTQAKTKNQKKVGKKCLTKIQNLRKSWRELLKNTTATGFDEI